MSRRRGRQRRILDDDSEEEEEIIAEVEMLDDDDSESDSDGDNDGEGSDVSPKRKKSRRGKKIGKKKKPPSDSESSDGKSSGGDEGGEKSTDSGKGDYKEAEEKGKEPEKAKKKEEEEKEAEEEKEDEGKQKEDEEEAEEEGTHPAPDIEDGSSSPSQGGEEDVETDNQDDPKKEAESSSEELLSDEEHVRGKRKRKQHGVSFLRTGQWKDKSYPHVTFYKQMSVRNEFLLSLGDTCELKDRYQEEKTNYYVILKRMLSKTTMQIDCMEYAFPTQLRLKDPPKLGSQELIFLHKEHSFSLNEVKILHKITVVPFTVLDSDNTDPNTYYCQYAAVPIGDSPTFKIIPLVASIDYFLLMVHQNKIETVKEILHQPNHVDINEHQRDTLSTAVHFAAEFGHSELMSLLLDSGASPNSQDRDNSTPLHFASVEGFVTTKSTRCAEILLEHGARIDLRDKWDKTAYDWVKDNPGHNPIARVFKKFHPRLILPDVSHSPTPPLPSETTATHLAPVKRPPTAHKKASAMSDSPESPIPKKPKISSLKKPKVSCANKPVDKKFPNPPQPAAKISKNVPEVKRPPGSTTTTSNSKTVTPLTANLPSTTRALAPKNKETKSVVKAKQTETTFPRKTQAISRPQQAQPYKQRPSLDEASLPPVPRKAPDLSLAIGPSIESLQVPLVKRQIALHELMHMTTPTRFQLPSKYTMPFLRDDYLSLEEEIDSSISDLCASGHLELVKPATDTFVDCDRVMAKQRQQFKVRACHLELARAWRVTNTANQQAFNSLAISEQQSKSCFFYGSWESLKEVITNGFHQWFGNHQINIGHLIGLSTYATRCLPYHPAPMYCLACEAKIGKMLALPNDCKLYWLEPQVLKQAGYDSVFLRTGSPWAPMFGFTQAAQVYPKYLLLYRSVYSQRLKFTTKLSGTVQHPIGQFQKECSRIGKLKENDDFLCLWDPMPIFDVHCNIVCKHQRSFFQLSNDDVTVALLTQMDAFAHEMEKLLQTTRPGHIYRHGFLTNPYDEQLHCHIVSINRPEDVDPNSLLRFSYPSFVSIRTFIKKLRTKKSH